MSETWDHWFVGGDNSGDVMVWRNMVEMRSWVKEEIGDVHLVRLLWAIYIQVFYTLGEEYIKERERVFNGL